MYIHFVDCFNNDGFLANLSDLYLTASSHYEHATRSHGPERSRLNTVGDSDGIGGWASGTDIPAWIQADLRQAVFMHKIATQGREGGNFQQWVTLFSLSYGFDVETLEDVSDPYTGVAIEFIGNTDTSTVVYNEFESVLTRFVRLNVIEYGGHATLRWEVYGCTFGAPSCPNLSSSHVQLNNSDVIVGSHVSLECNDGFRLLSTDISADVTCQASGHWTADLEDLDCLGA